MTTTTRPAPRPGIVVCLLAFGLGVAVSVAANVAHTWHPTKAQLDAHTQAGGDPTTWSPEIGAQFGAAFWPLALLLCVEILQRVPWPSGIGWTMARYGGTTVVAGVAAVVSYGHLRGLLLAYGEPTLTATIGPLAVDGLMVVSSFGLLALSSRSRSTVVHPETSTVDHPTMVQQWTTPDRLDHRPADHPTVDHQAVQTAGPGPVAEWTNTVDEEPVHDGPQVVTLVHPKRSTSLAMSDGRWTATVDQHRDRTSASQVGGPDRVDLPIVDHEDHGPADQEDRTTGVDQPETGTSEMDRPGPVDQDQVDQIAELVHGVDRTTIEAALRIVDRGDQISRRSLREEGVSGGTAKLNLLARRLREAIGQEARLEAV